MRGTKSFFAACSRSVAAAACVSALACSARVTLLAPPPPPVGAGGRAVFQPCPEVSCQSKDEIAAAFFDGAGSGGRPSRMRRRELPPLRTAAADASRPAAALAAAGALATAAAVPLRRDCPSDREELGRSTWDFVSAD